MTNEVMPVEQINAVEIFTKDGLDSLLTKIEEEAKAQVFDVNTKKGQKDIASMAHKVARSKTALDNAGKDLVADQKAAIKKIDAERKRSRDFLDNLKTEVRKPLDDYEAELKAKEEGIKARIVEIQQYEEVYNEELEPFTTSDLKERYMLVMNIEVDDSFGDYIADANEAKRSALEKIELAQLRQEKAEREAAEAEERRKQEEAERQEREAKERAEREEQIRMEAEAKAKAEQEEAVKQAKESEERAKREAMEAEQRREREAREAAERAELEKQQAIEQAKREAEAAEMSRREAEERARLEAEQQEKKRQENVAHRKRINNAALKCLVKEGLSEEEGKKVIEAIARGMIQNVSINY
jgi:hypothetical protein